MLEDDDCHRPPLPADAAAHRQHPHRGVEQRRHAVADDAREPGWSEVGAFSHVVSPFLDWRLPGCGGLLGAATSAQLVISRRTKLIPLATSRTEANASDSASARE